MSSVQPIGLNLITQNQKLMKQKFKTILIVIVAIVTIWGGHTYAMTPPTPECPPAVGTRYIASTAYIASAVSPASTPPQQFKIQNSQFQITLRGGSPANEQSYTIDIIPDNIVTAVRDINGQRFSTDGCQRNADGRGVSTRPSRFGRSVFALPLSDKRLQGNDCSLSASYAFFDTAFCGASHVGVIHPHEMGIRRLESMASDHLTGKEVTSHV